MKMKRTHFIRLLLICVVCLVTCFFVGCDSNRKKVDWNAYDESTSRLILSNYGLKDKDIAPLQNLTGLVSLTLIDNQISDLTPLANLTNLTELHLFGNQICDLAPLANLTNLTELYLGNNQISDLTPLANLTNLTRLYVGNNKISDLAPLANLTKLEHVRTHNNNITDWSPVAHVSNVEGNPQNAVLLTETTTVLKTGHIYYVSLEETQSIPSRWKANISDESLLRLICTEVDSKGLTSEKPGARGEKRVFYFEALSLGSCTIDMYMLPMNIDNDIEQTYAEYSYTFDIQD